MAQPEVLHRAALIHFGKAGVAVTASCPAQLELTGPGGSGTKYLLVRDSSTQTLLQLPVQRDLCCLPADSAAATIYDSQQQGWLAQFASAEDWHAFARQLGLARYAAALPASDNGAAGPGSHSLSVVQDVVIAAPHVKQYAERGDLADVVLTTWPAGSAAKPGTIRLQASAATVRHLKVEVGLSSQTNEVHQVLIGMKPGSVRFLVTGASPSSETALAMTQCSELRLTSLHKRNSVAQTLLSRDAISRESSISSESSFGDMDGRESKDAASDSSSDEDPLMVPGPHAAGQPTVHAAQAPFGHAASGPGGPSSQAATGHPGSGPAAQTASGQSPAAAGLAPPIPSAYPLIGSAPAGLGVQTGQRPTALPRRSLDLPSYDSPATPKLSELASASRSLDSRSGSASAAILSEILAAKHQQAASSPFAVVRAQPSRVQALEKRPSPFQVAAYAAGADGAPKDKAPQPATDLGALRTSGDMASANSSPARTMHPSELGPRRTSGEPASTNGGPTKPPYPAELGPRKISGEAAGASGSAPRSLQPANSAAATDASSQRTVHSCPEELMMDRRLSAGSVTSLGPDGDGVRPPHAMMLGRSYSEKHQLALKVAAQSYGNQLRSAASVEPPRWLARKGSASEPSTPGSASEHMTAPRLPESTSNLNPSSPRSLSRDASFQAACTASLTMLRAGQAGLSCSMGDVLARLDLLAQHLGIDVAATLPQPAAPQVPEVNKPNKVDSLISQVEASLQLPKGEEAAPGRSLSPTTAVRRQLEMVGKQLHSVQAQRAEEGRPTWRIPSELDLAKTQSLPGAMEVLPVGELTRLQQQLRFVEVSAADSEMEVARLQARLHESERAVAEAKSEVGRLHEHAEMLQHAQQTQRAQHAEVLHHLQQAGGEASRQRVSDFAKQVADSMRSVMNQLYTSLAGEFEDDVSYKGREVEHVLRCTIRDSTSDAFEAIKAITSKAVAALESTGPTSVGPAEAKP